MRIFLGITGASGSILGVELFNALNARGIELYVTATRQGLKVCEYETDINLKEYVENHNKKYFDIDDLFAPMCSGSFNVDASIICPCSMGTLARISSGISQNLIERASDVAIKERKKLILVPRETPLSNIHLKNMLTLSECGAIIVPPSISFYSKPKSITDIVNFFVGRILNQLGIDNNLSKRWGEDIKYEVSN
ncbi:flavin prenyltransferase UbiX [Clostridium sp. BNL1100]|uniref:UbiX family flavin prenyltransferase n=1 Tax=Clostridium sp. BNL1100 TaxID=755731 RepID=UPI00024A7BFF|nr:flavin prenyltransferase UbiX [Clostridium sp. BNL1100]AEY67486.1 polyprenyl p-hydroxybenzoate/phenylacrylic acid decarboxylase [Clostridium sp. BNL1100]